MSKDIAYAVTGHWPFPTEMLRYDQSRPATAADQAIIDKLTNEHVEDKHVFEEATVNLIGPNKPNTARWESFGWKVPGDKEHEFFREFNAAAREEQRVFDAAMAKLDPAERLVVEARINRGRSN